LKDETDFSEQEETQSNSLFRPIENQFRCFEVKGNIFFTAYAEKNWEAIQKVSVPTNN
jgi:hypothetical protein